MAEETKNYLLEEDNETSGFDYKAFLVKLLMYWPWILGCVVIFLIGAFFYLKTLTPLYTVSSSVLIKNESKGGTNGANLEDLGFVSSSTRVWQRAGNPAFTHLIKKVVTALDLYVSYSVPGQFRNTELYKQSPVKVWVTPEEAERMGYAQVKMSFRNQQLHEVLVEHEGQEWKKTVEVCLPYSPPLWCIHFLCSRLHPANYPACTRRNSGYRHIT